MDDAEKEKLKADNEAKKKDPEHILVDEKTDNFSREEQKKIVRMCKQDLNVGLTSMSEWIEKREKDIQMYQGERPSIIEDLEKEDWMSDRNMGLCAANCDAYQATLLSTCYNIDTIHFMATEKNDFENKDQLEEFTRWGLGKSEADLLPQVDDFIHNKVTQGISYFYIYWKVWYEWIDRRIPKFGKGKLAGKFFGYEIKTELKRFEKGVIENIADVSDLIMPLHGSTLQDKAWLIHRLHKRASDITDLSKQGVFVDCDADYIKTLTQYCYDHRSELLGGEKAKELGLVNVEDIDEDTLRLFPVEIFNWYGPYTKNGKTEEYRFTFEANTSKFLAGKPLRKITRSGKRPFVGRPFIRRPGAVQGTSLPRLIADPCNSFNNVFNQKSDFQYVENCPWGWYNPDEENKKQERKIIPGTLMPSNDPESVVIPNISRSMAWAESDYKVILETIERLTGAAAYFMSNSKGVSGTATRDAIINEKSETRFGLWVNRIIDDIAEAITMWVHMYQDWAPPSLGERVLGEDGKPIFRNFSIESLRGSYDARITPDIISGSRTLEKEIALWGLETLSQSVWFDPSFNPKGNWNLYVNAAKKAGLDIKDWMPPEPKSGFGQSKLVKDLWTQIKQGQIPDVDETDDIMSIYMGMMEIAESERHELDKEYQANLDVFLMRINMAMQKFIQQQAIQQRANNMAMQMITDVEQGRIKKEDVIDA